jgi:hypothetical protein
MAGFFKNWDHKRKAYKKLPKIIRTILAGLAFVMAPVGVIAMFTPLAVLEVGSILIFTSLTILSFEFDWAYNLLSLLRKKLADKTMRNKLTVFTLAIIVTYAVVTVLWLVSR